MPADILVFADAVAAKLQTEFDAAGASTTVARDYSADFDVGTFTGLKVVVMPVEYAKDSPADRSEDYFDPGVVVVVAERYASADAARPPKEWVDARVDLVERCVFDPLRKAGVAADFLLDAYWSQSVEVTTVYDAPFLREHGTFWSEIEVSFRKIRDAL